MPRNQINNNVLRCMQITQLESTQRDLMIEAKTLREKILKARRSFSIHDTDDETYKKDEKLNRLLEKKEELLERIYSNKKELDKFSKL